jgi:hypothetical protein
VITLLLKEFQSRQQPWVSFPNPPLLCLLLCAILPPTPHSFCFQGEEHGQGWWDWRGQVWVDQVGVSHGSRQPSMRLQVLQTVFYLQGWMLCGLDQVGDGLLWDIESDAHEGTCRQDQDVSDFVEGSSLALFWTSSHEEVGSSRLRCPWQWTHRMGLNTPVQQFVERLNDLNRYLLCFPEENPKQLD